MKNYTFVQNSSKWSTETGYNDSINPDTFPYEAFSIPYFVFKSFKVGLFFEFFSFRAFGVGRHESFTVIVRVLNSNRDLLCGGATEGYRIAFHLPNELPHVRKKYYQVSTDQAGMFMVAPNLISTSQALRNHPAMVRQCYFDAERQLRFYQFYSQHNCEAECLTNYSLNACGCVHAWMPREREKYC